MKIMSSQSDDLLTLFLDRLTLPKWFTGTKRTPVTDKCPSWMNRRRRMV